MPSLPQIKNTWNTDKVGLFICNPKLLNLKSLTTGTYFIELTTKDGKSLKEKFIKE